MSKKVATTCMSTSASVGIIQNFIRKYVFEDCGVDKDEEVQGENRFQPATLQ